MPKSNQTPAAKKPAAKPKAAEKTFSDKRKKAAEVPGAKPASRAKKQSKSPQAREEADAQDFQTGCCDSL